MNQTQAHNQNLDINSLFVTLSSTLNSGLFFNEICKFLSLELPHSEIKAYLLKPDHSFKLVSHNLEMIEDGEVILKGHGINAQVAKTKKGYFSNSVERDPSFSESEKTCKTHLAIPVSSDGIILGVIHLIGHDDSIQFGREHILKVNKILSEIQAPVANMKMYLAAINLNEALLKQIEMKDSEHKHKGHVQLSAVKESHIERMLVGTSKAFTDMLKITDKIASTEMNIMICGEFGTGRESIARRIHSKSMRKDHAIIVVDARTMNDTELEIELFGKGHNVGSIEKANKGTLIVKNIASLNAQLQARIMSFVKTKQSNKCNSVQTFNSDIRLILAFNSKMSQIQQQGIVKDEFLYSLNLVHIDVPSLKERQDDIALLASHFVNEGKDRSEHKMFSPGALRFLQDFKWPGNIAELQSVVEKMAIVSDSSIIDVQELPEKLLKKEEVKQERSKAKMEEVLNQAEILTLEELEKMHICRVLEHLSGNKTKAAKLLGVTVKTLYNKLHAYGMIEAREM